MLEGGQAQAKEEWVNAKQEVKGSIRMELRIREVDKGGDNEPDKNKARVSSTGSAGSPLASSETRVKGIVN